MPLNIVYTGKPTQNRGLFVSLGHRLVDLIWKCREFLVIHWIISLKHLLLIHFKHTLYWSPVIHPLSALLWGLQFSSETANVKTWRTDTFVFFSRVFISIYFFCYYKAFVMWRRFCKNHSGSQWWTSSTEVISNL